MKNLKIVLVVLLMLGGMSFAIAQQKVVKIYPKHGTVVTKVHKSKLVVHNKVNFRFANGVWYKPQGKRFVVCAAPVGVQIRHLPRGNKVIKLRNGRKVYHYKGIWYKKKGQGYVVVTA